ncbi:MAG: plsC1 [Myxococcaceae bacterium]|nr:plsC1 [Myxococcaceae bacterium]
MQLALARALPEADFDKKLTRTGSRAARIGAFALEMWSRLLLDGAPDEPDERARELSWVAENMCALHGVRLSVRGQPPQQASLLVANHISYFDPMIIASLLPLTAVAKREVASWPWVGEVCRRFGVLYVDRDDPYSGARVLREAMRSLERGVSVLIFPEGTTTHGDHVLPFKRGSFGAAALAGVPIVPVALRYESAAAAWVGDDTFLPHYVRTVAKPYTRVQVEFLPALSHAHDAADLARQARSAIATVVKERATESAHQVPRLRDAWSVASA